MEVYGEKFDFAATRACWIVVGGLRGFRPATGRIFSSAIPFDLCILLKPCLVELLECADCGRGSSFLV